MTTAQIDLFPTVDHPAEAAWYAEVAAHRGWHVAAEAAMRYLCRRGDPFTADDLRPLLADCEPPHPNAIGGLFMVWSKRGAIRKVGWGSSRLVSRRGGNRALWVATDTSTE